jgi:hypothetical protein
MGFVSAASALKKSDHRGAGGLAAFEPKAFSLGLGPATRRDDRPGLRGLSRRRIRRVRRARALCLSLSLLGLVACSGGTACADTLGEFLGSLHELDSRLDVGLNVNEYSNRVGDLKVAYDKIALEDLPQECVTKVGVPAEEALNQYMAALTQWRDCITYGSGGCEPQLQDYWSGASDKIAEADKGLGSG